METLTNNTTHTATNPTVTALNTLLAGFQVYYQNLRGLHWNIEGAHFFDLHQKYEDWYNEAADNIDEVAERIKTLDAVPLHSFADYLAQSPVSPVTNVTNGKTGISLLLDQNVALLEALKEVRGLAAQQDDEGTLAMVSEMMATIEKRRWMLRAYLK